MAQDRSIKVYLSFLKLGQGEEVALGKFCSVCVGQQLERKKRVKEWGGLSNLYGILAFGHSDFKSQKVVTR